MTIRELRILPPLAIGRLGGADEPQDNYSIEENPRHPLGFRRIVGAPTLVVDEATGEIVETRVPDPVTFTAGGHIKPVAPFLEVFVVTADDRLEPLTLDLLRRLGLGPHDVSWRVRVANRKVVRRTGNEDNLVAADTAWFSTHDRRPLEGHCKNFIAPDRFIDFGHARYIRPNAAYPQIRLRFMPARGLIYGPNRRDPYIPRERAIYDRKGDWVGYELKADGNPDKKGGNETLPPSLYAIDPPAPPWLYDNVAKSRGYLDDACDGFVEVALTPKGGARLEAAARITAGPPAVVPDSLFVRSLADDLDQVIHGPEVPKDEPPGVTRARAEDIVRRAFETVRFMNVVVLNGNAVDGRDPLTLDSMPEEESADTERAIRPIMSPSAMDTRAILALHEQVFAALRGGAAPWFVDLLRKPDEVADYTDHGRRKMPALMCAADNSYLALTWRQIDTIRRASTESIFDGPPAPVESGAAGAPPAPSQLTPRNRSAQVHYAAAGNPVSSRPVTAIANCCPGLEVDFRNVWRRMLEGVVLREYDNLVVDVDPGVDSKIRRLKGRRLLRVAGVTMMTEMRGPATSDVDGSILLTTDLNPYGLAPLEWSNALAHVLHAHAGKTVACDFSKDEGWTRQLPFTEDPKSYITVELKMRPFFEADTALISRGLADAGELTQGLCSPWQNDYRECSCYYWASARPDFVNVEVSPSGLSEGDNYFQKERTGRYVPDDYLDQRLVMYNELFEDWEKWLRFQIGGRDVPPRES
jgi:hypothetical protein